MFDKAFVDKIDWGVLSLSAALTVFCLAGAAYTVPWALVIRGRAARKDFNSLWATRLCLQITGALFAASLLLRLQLLWGRSSVLPRESYQPGTLCRLYLAFCLGLSEPAFLLLALFSCLYSLKMSESKSDPTSIVMYALGFTLPTCAAQVFAAMFTKIVDTLDYKTSIHSRFFPPYEIGNAKQCGGDQFSGCKICVYPVFSTLVSCGFGILYLFSMWHVTRRIARAVINQILKQRIVLFRRCVAVLYTTSVALRGCTVLFRPHMVAFEILRVGHAVAVAGLIVSVSFLLVLVPVYDAHLAEYTMRGDVSHDRPTELMPLVHPDGIRQNSVSDEHDA